MEENKVSGPKPVSGYRGAGLYLTFRGAGKLDFENIPVDLHDKGGTVDPLPVHSPQAVGDVLPEMDFRPELFFNVRHGQRRPLADGQGQGQG